MKSLSLALAAGLALTAGLALGLLPACSPDDGDGQRPEYGTMAGSEKPPPPPETGPAVTLPAGLPQWVDVSAEAGITAENHSGKPAQKDWIVSGMGGGSIVLDYDGDGDMDLVVVDGTMLTSEGVLEYDDAWRTRLYRNDGNMHFTDVTTEAGVDIQAFGFGGASCDYDSDGHTDFFVCAWGANYLMRNRGDGTFENVAEAAGVIGDVKDMSTSCAFGDVDGDGVHDLYVANYIDQWKQIEDYRAEGRAGRTCPWRGFKVYCGPPGLPPQADRLYLGNGDGTFREVTREALAYQFTHDSHKRFGFQPVMTDVDADGDLDIYVANDTQKNFLWVNDGNGVFQERGVEAGVAMDVDVKEQAGMGVDAADVNRDGRIDLFVTNFSHDYNTLYVNQTTRADAPLFADLSHRYNVARLSYLRLCWGTRLFDMDNDGDLDMFVACGHVYGEIENFSTMTGTSYEQKNLLLVNTGPPDYRFEDATEASGPAFQIQRVWRGAVFADFDDDGDQDVFTTSLNGKPGLYRNDGGNDKAYVVVRLVGAGGQRDPSGARVEIETRDGRKLLEEHHNGASFCCDNDPRLFFGLGDDESAARMVVTWPDGTAHTFEDVATRRFYLVEQDKGELTVERQP